MQLPYTKAELNQSGFCLNYINQSELVNEMVYNCNSFYAYLLIKGTLKNRTLIK